MTIGQRNWNTPTAILYPGGSTRSQSLDGFQRLTELRVKDPGQTDLMRYRYAFDAENNILQKDTEHGRYDYQYDSLYRLTAADHPVVLPDEAYGYDFGQKMLCASTNKVQRLLQVRTYQCLNGRFLFY